MNRPDRRSTPCLPLSVSGLQATRQMTKLGVSRQSGVWSVVGRKGMETKCTDGSGQPFGRGPAGEKLHATLVLQLERGP